ncbi:MAG: BatD family protein [Bdellovibrionales bacterium]
MTRIPDLSLTSFFALLFALSAPLTWAAEGVEVTGTVDRNRVGVGDVISFTITVNAKTSVQVEQPSLPPIDGMELINTSTGVETRSTFAGGKFLTEQARTFSYMLAASKKGTLTIPAVPVTVEGQTLRTKPIEIAVSEARAIPPQAQPRGGMPPDPFAQMDEMEELFQQMLQRRFGQQGHGQGQAQDLGQQPINPDEAFFIQAEVDKKSAYVGEQVTATFYLYTRGQIRDIDTLKYPDLKGFWKEDLEMATRLNFEQVVINGLAYQRALLVSYALFPIKAGKATVDSYKAKCTVLTPSSFGFGQPYRFTKASKPIPVEVKEIPTENRPSNFTGAVGTFRVTAKFEPPTGVVNQPVTLRVRFEGRGNAKLIELPKLELPPSFEIYDQKSQAKFLRDGTSFKEFEVLIIPREPGVFDVPAVAISVFDPETRAFNTAASQPLNISVTGTAVPSPTPQIPGVSSVENEDDKTPKLPLLATEMGRARWPSSVWIALTVAIYVLVLLFLGYLAWHRWRRKPKRVSLGLVLNRRLQKVRELVSQKDFRRVGVEMTNTAYFILGQLSEEGGANQEVSRLLESTPPSVRNELAQPIAKLLSQCEALSFAPENLIGDMTEKKKLETLIVEFEKIMKRAIELAEI